jgi:protein-tyrosine phosphatase
MAVGVTAEAQVPMGDVLAALRAREPGPAQAADPTRVDITTDPANRRMIGVSMHGNKPFNVPFMSKIAENLYQGGCTSGLVLPDFVQHLVSLYPWEAYQLTHELESYLCVRMYDSADFDAATAETVLDIASWVNSRRASGVVLVHCQAGLNRSSVVAGAAMVMNDEMTGPEAVEYLRAKRSAACLCNPSFEKWLRGLTFGDA